MENSNSSLCSLGNCLRISKKCQSRTKGALKSALTNALEKARGKTHKETCKTPYKKKPIFSICILLTIILCCIFAPLLANHDPSKFYLDSLNTAPNTEFYFGTDSLGRDIYSIMFFGGRISLSIGILGALIIAIISIVYGTLSAMLSDRLDSILMRIAEIASSIPTILLVLLLSALFKAQNVLTISFIIGISSWFNMARIVRSEVRQLHQCEYVLYATCSGGSFFYVLWHHLIPNFLPTIMFMMISNISGCIIMESTLSFLGLGLPIETLSWGSMLSLANKALILNTWWVIVIPGLFLVITLMCITNIANYFSVKPNQKPAHL